MWESEVNYYSTANDVIYHYKWANPSLVERIVDSLKIAEGSISASARLIACDEQLRTPTVTKEELAMFKFASLSSTSAGDGDLFSKIVGSKTVAGDRTVLLIARFREKKSLAVAWGPSTVKALEGMTYITLIDFLEVDCKERKATTVKDEYYDENDTLVAIRPFDPTKPGAVVDMPAKSPLGALHQVTCS
jgi:hypothetical protein